MSDIRIASLSFIELQWYACMMEHDNKEAYNKNLDYLEYLAAFSHPERVGQARQSREQEKSKQAEDPEMFAKVVSSLFGQEISKEDLSNE